MNEKSEDKNEVGRKNHSTNRRSGKKKTYHVNVNGHSFSGRYAVE